MSGLYQADKVKIRVKVLELQQADKVKVGPGRQGQGCKTGEGNSRKQDVRFEKDRLVEQKNK